MSSLRRPSASTIDAYVANQSCGLLRLPLELRRQIYGLTCPLFRAAAPFLYTDTDGWVNGACPELMQTCRQIRLEIADSNLEPYLRHSFYIDDVLVDDFSDVDRYKFYGLETKRLLLNMDSVGRLAIASMLMTCHPAAYGVKCCVTFYYATSEVLWTEDVIHTEHIISALEESIEDRGGHGFIKRDVVIAIRAFVKYTKDKFEREVGRLPPMGSLVMVDAIPLPF